MKRKQWIAIFLLCALLISGLCGCKEEKSSSAGKKPGKEDSSDEPGGNGGTPQNPEGGDDFWENEEGLTIPPLTAPSETPEEVVDSVLSALQEGNWSTVNQRIFNYSLQGGNQLEFPKGGILEKIAGSMTVKSRSLTDNGDGSYQVDLTVEIIDCRSLLNSLPEGIESKDAAKEELLRLADTAPRSTFSAEFKVLRYYETGYYFIEPSESFVNAITGGYYDVYWEEIEKEAAE